MGTTAKAVVMLTVVAGGVVAYKQYGPLPPKAQRCLDDALAAAQGFFARHGVVSAGTADPMAPLVETEWDLAATAAPTPAPVAAPPAAAPTAGSASPSPAGQLQPLLDQLLRLGVGEYELTRWGSSGQLYRFRCAAPLAGSMEQTQQFEAVASTPLAAVEQVLSDASSWRLARSEASLTR